MRNLVWIVILMVATSTAGCSRQTQRQPVGSGPTQSSGSRPLPSPGTPVVGVAPPMPKPVSVRNPDFKIEVIASGLEVPWDMAFVSTDRIYVTERPGRIRLIKNGVLQTKPYATIKVNPRGEGGLMGIALHPNYPNPSWVYLMYTSGDENRISRFTDTGSGLSDEKPIVTGIAAAFVHNGGIIRFGPDGMLYAGTGEGGVPERAQDLSSLNGKILRMTPDGKPPADNPFPNSIVYAYGFRNVQGLAWNPSNNDLWAVNHGPTGEFGLEAKDSVYIVKKGGNHGWPRVLGVTNVRDVVDPTMFYPDVAIAPARALFYNSSLIPSLKGNFLFTTLRGEKLVRVVLSDPRKIESIEDWWATGTQRGTYGRLRGLSQGPDGAIYVTTSNRDGRGTVHSGDDKLIRISPK